MRGSDPKLVKSPLSQTFTSDGISVNVDIYRLDGAGGWTLELVDANWNSIVWDELFLTDEEAWQEFLTGVQEIGLARLLEPDDDDPPMATIH
ncbi:MAG: hypothetical protein MEQ84_12960 [Mesorhizobium sp.]|nr:hypothetical protein [Mesorhizobium sp.]